MPTQFLAARLHTLIGHATTQVLFTREPHSYGPTRRCIVLLVTSYLFAVAPQAGATTPGHAIDASPAPTIAANALPDSVGRPAAAFGYPSSQTTEGYRWRLRLDYSWTTPKLAPWVPFYRSEQEVPNQEVIRPERGPEELFVVGSFQAFEVEETSNHYRLALEHQLGGRLWVYGGVRHQRLVYRLDDERTRYRGTEADLLFRGRIRYRETSFAAGLTYRIENIQKRFSTDIRAGVLYHSERSRVFDGSLRARMLASSLPFRYREELLPRYRWGYQAEMTINYHLTPRTTLYTGFGFMGSSDGVLRYQSTLLGVSRQF